MPSAFCVKTYCTPVVPASYKSPTRGPSPPGRPRTRGPPPRGRPPPGVPAPVTTTVNAIKLPMSKNGRSCTSEYGCDELMNGDTVYVEGYKDAFKVTIYENSSPQYIPYL